MVHISVGDTVRIVSAKPGEQKLLHKVGSVVMITDRVNCFVTFEDGSYAQVDIKQLEKAS